MWQWRRFCAPIALFMMDWASIAGGSAALATAFLWACSGTAWGFAGRRIGALAVNILRISLASAILWGCYAIAHGAWLPQLSGRAWVLLGISGAIGVGIGDICYFRCVVIMGPRLASVVLALSPIFASAISYFPPLREHLGAQALVGICLTVAGVTWVVAEPGAGRAWQMPKDASFVQGLALGIAGSMASALGMVLTRMAFVTGAGELATDSSAAAVVRVWAGLVVTAVAVIASRRVVMVGRSLSDGRSMLIVLAGTLVGPVLGIWLSMVALKLIPAGIGVALIYTSPIMMVPLAWAFYHERPTGRAIAGTVLAVLGAALLMLR